MEIRAATFWSPSPQRESCQSSVILATEIIAHPTVSPRPFHTFLCNSDTKKSNDEYWFSKIHGTSAYSLVNTRSWTLLESIKWSSLHALHCKSIASKKNKTSSESNIVFLHAPSIVADWTFSFSAREMEEGRWYFLL